jgi:hypothetical protein
MTSVQFPGETEDSSGRLNPPQIGFDFLISMSIGILHPTFFGVFAAIFFLVNS